jgi:lysozyme family protein
MFGSNKNKDAKAYRVRLDDTPLPVERGQIYVSARVLCKHVPRNGRKRQVFALWSVTCPHPTEGDVTFERLEAPSMLGQTDISQLQRVEEANERILGTVPFHDDIKFQIGLFSAPIDGKADHYLGLLAELGHMARNDFFLSTLTAPAAPFLNLMTTGVEFALDKRNDSPVQLEVMSKFSMDGTNVQPGKWVVIFGDPPRGRQQNLTFDEQTGRVMIVNGSQKTPLEAPHIAYAIEVVESRHDWFRIPDILQAWDDLRAAVIDGYDTNYIEEMKDRFHTTCMTSPDLIRPDALNLSTMIRESFAAIDGESAPSAESYIGGSQPEMFGLKMVAQQVKQRVPDMKRIGNLRDFVNVDRLRDIGQKAVEEAQRAGVLRPQPGQTNRPPASAPDPSDRPAPPTPSAAEPTPVPATPPVAVPPPTGLPAAPDTLADLADSTPLNARAEEIFQEALAFTKGWEGGYVDHPADRGGKTNFGIIQPTLNRFRSARNLPYKSVADITFEEAKAIYREDFFEAANCHQMPEKIAVAVFDARVNHSPRVSGRLLQKGINGQPDLDPSKRLKVDGYIGRGTIAALQDCDVPTVLRIFCDEREKYYLKLVDNDPSQEAFRRGWLNRVNSLRRHLGLPVPESFSGGPDVTPKTPDFFEEDWFEQFAFGGEEPLDLDDLPDAIEDAIEDSPECGQAVDDIIEILRLLPPAEQEPHSIATLKTLKQHRADAPLALVASALMMDGITGAVAWRHAAQARIDLGQLEEADLLARELLRRFTSDADCEERRTALTMLGRIAKQRYLDAAAYNEADADPEDLMLAAKLYERGFREKVETLEQDPGTQLRYGPYYEGINVLALAMRGDRAGIPVLPEIDRATRLLYVRHEAEKAVKAGKDTLWAELTLAELLVAEGNYLDAQEKVMDAIAGCDQDSLFEFASFTRQLHEVWQLDLHPEGSEARQLLATLDVALLRLTGEIDGPLTDTRIAQLQTDANLAAVDRLTAPEANIGGDGVMTIATFLDNLRQICTAIVKIKSSRPGRGTGTGFIMEGGVLSPDWAGQTVLVTNWHVVSPNGIYPNSIAPEEALAKFSLGEYNPEVRVGRILWGSEYEAYDCCILEIDISHLGGQVAPFRSFSTTPPDPKKDTSGLAKPIGTVNVIGHPLGQEMAIGTTGLHLHQYTYLKFQGGEFALEVPVLHYNSPTEPGSSGSPVLDMRSLELCGLHHAATTFKQKIAQVSPELAFTHKRGGPINRRSRRRPPSERRQARAQGAPVQVHTPRCNEGIWLAGIKEAIAKYPGGVAPNTPPFLNAPMMV